jgi:CBS domain-containing protein
MKRREVGCVPVLKEGRLVGAVTEHDFMEVAAELIQDHLEE